MRSRHAILAVLLITAIIVSAARAGPPPNRSKEGNETNSEITLDLVVSRGSLYRLLANLKKLGVQPVGAPAGGTKGSVRSHITVGPFSSAQAASQCGNLLAARGLIGGFTVRISASPRGAGKSSDSKVLNRAGEAKPGGWSSSAPGQVGLGFGTAGSTDAAGGGASDGRATSDVAASDGLAAPAPSPATATGLNGTAGAQRTATGPGGWKDIAALGPAPDRLGIAGPDPVKEAMRDITGVRAERNGGLWLAGDIKEGLSRLRWIAGETNQDLLLVAGDGRVTFNRSLLLSLSGADKAGAGSSFVLTDYIKSNEGLYLLAQIIAAENRYCLYMGRRIPTAGDDIEIDGAINLDNNFDVRINTYRRDGMKLPKECPPESFDSLIAINPNARWFNLRVRQLVPDGIIAFHELAEALAKVDFGLEYLPEGMRPGAHDIAVQRELQLQSERPNSDTVTTLGTNVVFTSWDDFLKFRGEHEKRPRRR